MKPVVVAPLVALALAAGGAGAYLWLSSGGSEQEVVAQPTSTPTATTVPSLTPTAVPSPTPTPLPGGKAPEGCVADEKAYVDPDGRFAFCYPKDMEVTTADTKFGTAVNVTHPLGEDNRVTFSAGGTIDPYQPCIIESPTIVKNERIEALSVDGETVQACFRDHYDQAQPDVLLYKSIDFMIKTEDGRPVIAVITYSGPDFERAGVPLKEVVMRMMGSAAIY